MTSFKNGLLFWFCSISSIAFCQQSINSGAANISNFSFTVGQVFTSDIFGSQESFQQGVHQVYASSLVTQIPLTPQQDYEVFPLPAQQDINIRLKGKPSTSFDVKLLDLSGRQIACLTNNKGNMLLSLAALSAGCYFLELESEGHKTTKKIIKK
ncbi:MAG: T9SS type A sorting domain-containing protein [Bacteroidia bacterium]